MANIADVTIQHDNYMFSGEYNFINIQPVVNTSKTFKQFIITPLDNIIVTNETIITFTIDDLVKQLVGVSDLNKVQFDNFYLVNDKVNILYNIRQAIMNDYYLNALIKAWVKDGVLYIQQRSTTQKLNINITISNNLTVSSTGETAWENSIDNGTGDSNIELSIYDYDNDPELTYPLLTLNKKYIENNITFELSENIKYLNDKINIPDFINNDLVKSFDETVSRYVIQLNDVYKYYSSNIFYTSPSPITVIDGFIYDKYNRNDTLYNYVLSTNKSGLFLTDITERNWNKYAYKDWLFVYSDNNFNTTLKYTYYNSQNTQISSNTQSINVLANNINIILISPELTDESISYFTVELSDNKTNIIKYNVVNIESDNRITLLFANSKGAYDTFQFVGNNNTITQNRETEINNIYQSINIDYTDISRNEKTYNTTVTDTYTLRSGVLSDEYANMLTKELANSKNVFDITHNRAIIIDELEIEIDSTNDNKIIELSYHYAY